MSKQVQLLKIIVLEEQFKQISSLERGINKYAVRCVIDNKARNLLYYGRHPPQRLRKNGLYEAEIVIRKNDLGKEYKLVNDPSMEGPAHFELVKAPSTKSNGPDTKDIPSPPVQNPVQKIVEEEQQKLEQSAKVLNQMQADLDDRKDRRLKLLDGVGPKTADDLRNVGFERISMIAAATHIDLQNVPGIGRNTAKKIIESAREIIESKDEAKENESKEDESKEDPDGPVDDDLEGPEEDLDPQPSKKEVEQATAALQEKQQETEPETDTEQAIELAKDLKYSITRALTKIDTLNYVPGYRSYRASWSSTKPRKIILLKHWPKYLNAEQRKTREEIMLRNGKYQLSGAKIGTIIHQHVEISEQFERNIVEEGWKLVSKEQKVSIPIEHPDGGIITLVGHIDAIYEHIETGQILVVDYKTRSSEIILKLWNGVRDRYTTQFYPQKVQDNFKQLIVYQHWAGKKPGVLIEVGRNKGEINHQINEYDPELWEKQKRFWFDIATIETNNELPPKCSEDPTRFPCSWGKGLTLQRCQFFGFCHGEYL